MDVHLVYFAHFDSVEAPITSCALLRGLQSGRGQTVRVRLVILRVFGLAQELWRQPLEELAQRGHRTADNEEVYLDKPIRRKIRPSLRKTYVVYLRPDVGRGCDPWNVDGS